MCGIVGIINSKGSIKNSLIKNQGISMLKKINHRGPDESKFILGRNHFFGSVRLSIEAISFSSQPFENNEIICGFNGEIFNYKNLIKSFFSKNKIKSEIELIANLWKLKKKKITEYIKGQYAIFIYDKSKEKTYLFRDHYGIRPLFYFLDNKNNFFFSSEIKSIVSANRNIKFKINQNSISNISAFWTNIGTNTSIENIHLLEPGCVLELFKGKINVKKFKKEFLFNNKYDHKITSKDLYDNFVKAVKNQMQSEVGYATYLSGGIDSSSLAYVLSKFSKKKLDAFSVTFNEKDYDESFFQKKLSKELNLNLNQIKITKKKISKAFPDVVNHTENILFRTAPAPMYLLSKEVNKKGHKVVFSGEGADEILYGYDIFFENRIRHFWNKDVKSKMRPLLFKKLYKYLPQFKNSRYFEMIKDFYKVNLKKTDSIFFSHFVRWQQYDFVNKFFNLPNKDYNINKEYNILKSTIPKKFKSLITDKKAQYFEINTLLSNYLLSSQGDRMTMAHSVEGRYPFLDEDFSKFVSKIPTNQLAPTIKSKLLFRNSFKNKISNQLVFRPKIAYQAPEARSFIGHNYLSLEGEEFIENLNFIDEHINKKNFSSLIKKFQDKYSSERLGFRENMVFIMGISLFFLKKKIKEWHE